MAQPTPQSANTTAADSAAGPAADSAAGPAADSAPSRAGPRSMDSDSTVLQSVGLGGVPLLAAPGEARDADGRAGGRSARTGASSARVRAIDPRLGTKLGKYRLQAVLGRGGTGTVYEAEDVVLQRGVAIKILADRFARDKETLSRFLNEARAVARINHPNVVGIHEIDVRDGTAFIVMELVKGGSAADFLRVRGPFPWPEATRIAADALRGLAAAHEAGLIHRDIKPGNIMHSARDRRVKLADFGLAKVGNLTTSEPDPEGVVAGTPQYMSPEQCLGDSPDHRSDLYSMGATYYTLLTGAPPFSDCIDQTAVMEAQCHAPVPDPRLRVADIPDTCVAVIQMAMAKSREERYASAERMLADLETVNAQAEALAASSAGLGTEPRTQWSIFQAMQDTASGLGSKLNSGTTSALEQLGLGGRSGPSGSLGTEGSSTRTGTLGQLTRRSTSGSVETTAPPSRTGLLVAAAVAALLLTTVTVIGLASLGGEPEPEPAAAVTQAPPTPSAQPWQTISDRPPQTAPAMPEPPIAPVQPVQPPTPVEPVDPMAKRPRDSSTPPEPKSPANTEPKTPAQTEPPITVEIRRPGPLSGAWPGTMMDLVFFWRNSSTLHALPSGRQCRLRPYEAARTGTAGEMVLAGGHFITQGFEDDLLEACRRSDQLTIEAVIRSDSASQDGPARIVTFSRNGSVRNFTLAQARDKLILRLRTTDNNDNGTAPQIVLGTLSAERYVHVQVSYAPGRLQCWLDGRPSTPSHVPRGRLSNWGSYHLLFGDEFAEPQPWHGQLKRVALWSRAVDADEAAERFALHQLEEGHVVPLP